MILLIVWDGLRPDMIRDDLTPFLARQSREGVLCRASRAVWPSATRINAASLTTGCYPARHGLVDNELYVPALDATKAISCADWRALQDMADLENGRLLTTPTLGEFLLQQGRRMVSGGSGSPGTTYLTNPTLTGPIANWAVAWPEAFERDLVQRHGALLSNESSSVERNRFVVGALRDVLIPERRPDVVTLWLTEPDHAQHYHGLLSAEAREMLRHVDAEVEALLAHLAVSQPEPLTVFVLSDHGFDTISPGASVMGALVQAGFKAAPDSSEIVAAGCGLYFHREVLPRLPEVAAWMLAQPWVSGVFVRDDLATSCPGALPQSAVGGAHPRSAELMFSYRWTDAPNEAGVPGTVLGQPGMAATHGSTSPYALNNALVAWGAGIKARTVSDAPCGIVDVAPTVLHLLRIGRPPAMDGRVLQEIIEGGPAPQDLQVTTHCRQAEANGHRQTAHYHAVDGHSYLDWVDIEAL
jgi:arylsulfatase A-like enzyme